MSRARRSGRRLAALALGVTLVAALAGCGGGSETGGPGTAAGTDQGEGRLSGELTVLAAASLTETFTELARTFEDAHPGTTVSVSFDSSATLAEQVLQGAPADVLATADQRTMGTVVDGDAVAGSPRVFATNRLALVVPADNPAGISTFADLDRPSVDYVVCVPSAPCGALTTTVLQEQDITHPPASEEVDVKAVLSKVELDEADAGIVYTTDAVAAGDKVRAIEVPGADRTSTVYPIAVLSGSAEPALARAWVQLVLSADGQRVLRAAGFGTP
ncbi:molybdate ABC transporter substrate-binding protein [Nocardioides mesophilus]|uniref:Molybdate ABC transporter substrate-binding protein n=1 Tax=Nocardioides mesophilus TaxID=433659 RepID=A0A7G9R7V0_9ACTN|nr:molybdate ABC transporter substrate-binding protein [Nocardioides mesophilus]QNN51675.1 molybdate ABC transporter substrate-binding protein [Nocardioides mesophilus]